MKLRSFAATFLLLLGATATDDASSDLAPIAASPSHKAVATSVG